MSVASQFSGRHSLSTSDLQTLTAPSSASNEMFDTDDGIKHEVGADLEFPTSSDAQGGAWELIYSFSLQGTTLNAKHSPVPKRATTNSTSDAELDSSVAATSPQAGLTPDEALSPSSAASPGETDTEDAQPTT